LGRMSVRAQIIKDGFAYPFAHGNCDVRRVKPGGKFHERNVRDSIIEKMLEEVKLMTGYVHYSIVLWI
jgi:hypothetical protein